MKHLISYTSTFAAVGILAVVGGCEQGDPLSPPSIRFGEDECAVCRMIISDDRYAAAVVVLDEHQRHQRLAFDDIGCLFEFEAAQPRTPILARYVKDRQQRVWLDAQAAELVHSRQLHTPMAFGLAAADSLQAARTIQQEFGGDFIQLEEARRRFEAGSLHISSIDDSSSPSATLENEKVIELESGKSLHLSLGTAQVLTPGVHPFELTIDGMTEQMHVEIEPEMPSMGHGSPDNVHPVLIADKLYRGQVNLTMAGPWVVHVSIMANDREIGRTTFAIEVKR